MKKHLIWILFFLLICVICVISFNLTKQGNIATIKSDGNVIKKIDLNTVTSPYEMTIDYNGNFNTVLIENGKISVTSADCPDKLCMKQSGEGGVPIVCLPNKLTISFDDSEFDAVS